MRSRARGHGRRGESAGTAAEEGEAGAPAARLPPCAQLSPAESSGRSISRSRRARTAARSGVARAEMPKLTPQREVPRTRPKHISARVGVGWARGCIGDHVSRREGVGTSTATRANEAAAVAVVAATTGATPLAGAMVAATRTRACQHRGRGRGGDGRRAWSRPEHLVPHLMETIALLSSHTSDAHHPGRTQPRRSMWHKSKHTGVAKLPRGGRQGAGRAPRRT